MIYKIFFSICLLFSGLILTAQEPIAENVILITFDGLRWQELFSGADKDLVSNKTYVNNPKKLKEMFWAETPEERRATLLPFFWSEIVQNGQIYGNRQVGNKADCNNNMWFSYPGYNEILTGTADDKNITSNDKINNPNVTILEYFNNMPEFKGLVGAFGSWDVFPYIINEERSGVPVNAGFEPAKGDDLTEKERFLNEMQDIIPSPWGSVRLDAFTHHYAMEFLKKKTPRLLYIAYGETDDFAHDGEYDHYLKSARRTDQFIKELWEFCQSHPRYANNTTFVITTDHGRGTQPLETWKHHGTKIKGAGEVWFALLGKGVPAKGIVTKEQHLYLNQTAQTVAKLLGYNFNTDGKKGEAIPFDK